VTLVNYVTIDKTDTSRAMSIVAYYSSKVLLPEVAVFTLFIISKGFCTIEINGTIYEIHAPSILCFDEQKSVKIIFSSCLEVRTIYFDPTFINRNMTIETIRSSEYHHLVEQHSFFQLSPFLEHNDSYHSVFSLNEDIVQKLSETMDKCKEQLETQIDWYWSCRARSYFMEILTYLERIYFDYELQKENSSSVAKTVPAEFSKILAYVDVNIGDSINVSDICKKFAINRTSLQKLFRIQLNMTFYEYLSMRRVESAAYMLRFTELALEEITDRIGLSSLQNFCKFFKKQTGCSPSKFRKSSVENRIDWQNTKTAMR
jgi:AraC-like DNA-binding protein